MVIGLISNNDEMAYRKEVQHLTSHPDQEIFFQGRLKKVHLSFQILENFYCCTIESILTNCVTVWYGNCSASDRIALQRVVKTAQRITGSSLPPLRPSRASDACVRRTASSKAVLTPTTDYSPYSLLGGAAGLSTPEASFLRLSPN
ncbi:hypothetical protein AALO_G00300110 [Alosa alosa]|uniref:Alkylated DNA repair protein AlkB homologue 8 N-terminal domain-containing protein n=1 Tax=Alosa alosa TaxID=278164 RepID=A0AAV6FHF8_9TELE|nr:hypothetical protein AALO_G00300110 [Alosa alosa]